MCLMGKREKCAQKVLGTQWECCMMGGEEVWYCDLIAWLDKYRRFSSLPLLAGSHLYSVCVCVCDSRGEIITERFFEIASLIENKVIIVRKSDDFAMFVNSVMCLAKVRWEVAHCNVPVFAAIESGFGLWNGNKWMI